MAINTSLLIASPTLQDYLVDNATGGPMANGVITLYQDNSRTTFKNWYYQSGSPGNYTYITLPNPLTLSAVGTIQDDNGNDTIPFFYPYDEDNNTTIQTYYITVTNSDGQQQFVRQNFPFLSIENDPSSYNQTLRNYLVNNRFWRNVGSINLSSYCDYLAPSQHDGYTTNLNDPGEAYPNSSSPDIVFLRNVTTATDTITFNTFNQSATQTNFQSAIAGEYYINMACSGATTGETQKCLQFPLSLHADTLSGELATISFWAQNVSGNDQLTVGIYQFLGTGGGTTSASIVQTFNLTNSWQQYITEPFAFPTSNGLTFGEGSDDALFIQFGVPMNTTYNTNLAIPALYLGTVIPTNDFDTYDQISSIFDSPRTGDIRISLNGFGGSSTARFGWVPMDDGTIGNPTSNATTRANADTWPLYLLMWTAFSSHQTYAPMLTSAGSPTSYGASAYADFTANNQLTLTKQAGRVIAGVGSANGGTSYFLGQYAGANTETLSQTNLPDPINLGLDVLANLTLGGGSNYYVFSNSGSTYPFINSGGNQPFSLLQPTNFYNIYIKL